MSVEIIHGDCLVELARMADEGVFVDAVITDPPYNLASITKRFGKPGSAPAQHGKDGAFTRASRGFMNKVWDSEVAFSSRTWELVGAVLKPGGYLVACGGTRTYHRMACAIEDAGFDIRDSICWLYASGMPKSHSLSKAIDRAAGAKREIIGKTRGKGGENLNQIVRNGNDADDARGLGAYGVGARQIDIDIDVTAPATEAARQWEGWGTALKPSFEPIVVARKPLSEKTIAANALKHGTGAMNLDACRVPVESDDDEDTSPLGRWPANTIHDGSAEVRDSFPESSGQQAPVLGTEPSSVTKEIYGHYDRVPSGMRGDRGSAARFFMACPFDQDGFVGERFHFSGKADTDDRAGSGHPTVKPVSLMRYLCRLVTPPGGTVLDPFAGSGTTLEAARREGFNAIGIEREAEYLKDIRRRVGRASGDDTPLFSWMREGE